MAKKNSRFVTVLEEGVIGECSIIVDRETGVNYLFVNQVHAGGLTVLLDKDGKPVITPIDNAE